MTAELSLAGAECSVDRDCTGEIAARGAKQFGELPEVGDGAGNLAAEVWIQPIGRLGGQCAVAVHRELILALFDVELLELDLSIVENRAEHDHVRGAIVPTQTIQFRPDRSSSGKWIARIAAKTEIARTERAAESLGEAERVGCLGERDTSRGA